MAVVRKIRKPYMVDCVDVEVVTITTGVPQTLYLDGKDRHLVQDKKAVLVDDVVSTGNTLEGVKALIDENTAGFLVEPIQGEAGVIIPPAGYFKAARDICNQHNVVLILDEIQTGLGRTGRLLAEEHEGIEADLTLVVGEQRPEHLALPPRHHQHTPLDQ